MPDKDDYGREGANLDFNAPPPPTAPKKPEGDDGNSAPVKVLQHPQTSAPFSPDIMRDFAAAPPPIAPPPVEKDKTKSLGMRR